MADIDTFVYIRNKLNVVDRLFRLAGHISVVDHKLSMGILNYPHNVHFLLVKVETWFITLHMTNVLLLCFSGMVMRIITSIHCHFLVPILFCNFRF